jgi:dihydrofolate reductase
MNTLNTLPWITAIFATDSAGGMGANGSMPWPRLTADMRNFKAITKGNAVIMGRNTWDSDMPTPLPNRCNVVVTRRALPLAGVAAVVSGDPAGIIAILPHTLVLDHYSTTFPSAWYVIGGADILRQWLPYCQRVVHTQLQDTWPCDTYFPQSEWQSEFEPDGVQRLQYTVPVPFTITSYLKTTSWQRPQRGVCGS